MLAPWASSFPAAKISGVAVDPRGRRRVCSLSKGGMADVRGKHVCVVGKGGMVSAARWGRGVLREGCKGRCLPVVPFVFV